MSHQLRDISLTTMFAQSGSSVKPKALYLPDDLLVVTHLSETNSRRLSTCTLIWPRCHSYLTSGRYKLLRLCSAEDVSFAPPISVLHILDGQRNDHYCYYGIADYMSMTQKSPDKCPSHRNPAPQQYLRLTAMSPKPVSILRKVSNGTRSWLRIALVNWSLLGLMTGPALFHALSV